ncbi:MAG: hypothetical protein Q9166_005764 [cf. Caloplaca sp. 2 TL-2023]
MSLLRIVLLLLAHTTLTVQVDILLRWWTVWHDVSLLPHVPLEARCNNIQPGTCCKPQPGLLQVRPRKFSSGSTTFYGLRMQQFGAGWGATGPEYEDIPDCIGTPILRTMGENVDPLDPHIYNPPDEDERPGTPERIVFAASWIDLRTRFPPNSAGARYLQWQGVKDTVWGKGSWSTESNGVPFGTRIKRRDIRGQRLNDTVTKGTVTIKTPVRWVFPDVYSVNGSSYMSDDPAKGVYRSTDGRILNLGKN